MQKMDFPICPIENIKSYVLYYDFGTEPIGSATNEQLWIKWSDFQYVLIAKFYGTMIRLLNLK